MTTKKKIVIGVFVAIAIVATLKIMAATGWDRALPFPLSRVTREVFAPMQKGITFLTEGTTDFLAYFSSNKELRLKNEEMSRRITQLEEQLFAIKEQETENNRLKNLLDYKEAKVKNYNLKMAKVIGRDPGSWYQTIIIDKGTNHGLNQGMTVVNHDGLVGIIINSTNNNSEVAILLDPESAVGARVFENRITPGVVAGTGRDGVLKMIHLSHDALVTVGQTVVTSGLGGLFPRGIRIGTVAEVNIESNGLLKTALIKPFVDFARLEEVFVIVEVITPEDDTTMETGGEHNT